MSGIGRLVNAAMDHSRAVIAAMLVLTVLAGAGAPMVEQSSSLDQFQSDTPESEKLEYVESNFTSGEENATTAQIVVRDDNVLSKESLLSILRFEQAIRENETVNATLAEENTVVGIPNVIATSAIRGERAAELRQKAERVQRLNESVQENRTEIERERSQIERRRAALNATSNDLRAALDTLREDPNASVRAEFEQVREGSQVNLTGEDYRTFERAAAGVRNARSEAERREAYRLGTRGVLADEYERLQAHGERLQERADRLQERAETLQRLASELEADRERLESAPEPTLSEQIDRIESMNRSEIDRTTERVLSENGSQSGAFGFMPTDYKPGETEANATMLLVTQSTEGAGGGPSGSASEPIVDAQLALQQIADDRSDGQRYLVFGGGLVTEEITDSMSDSLIIVGPLAILFVLVALALAYRDVLDILLGLGGIGVVLVWTFGFMGWAGIDFNQIFIAVPVLLIGLSIDYAIHIFMRHREERAETEGGPRESMRVALAGVGVALVWVTATTVIGFLSNLTSPVPPIQDFGVVSAVGITAALLVFGLLVPALKVEIDGWLEARGFDRRKRAFGTGGGAFSRLLGVGATAARKAPWIVIAVALVVSAGGTYGATQVDTSFSQEDFLAEDPPQWMTQLPEPFAPSDYRTKENLDYVNDRFVRQDSQAQTLVEGNVTDPAALAALDDAQSRAAGKNVTQTLPNGEADIESPLTAMEQVAAQNDSFNATLAAADTDGDGVPDRNVERVYDELYDVAPETAASVLHRTDDGDYRAFRMVVSVKGGAAGEAVTTQMREVASAFDGVAGVTATATGQAILNQIVQTQLLETVIESLLITLVAVFAFLMIAYRITEGSALLGAVTLLPVALSVSWILGTMYLAGIPFNVLTGMITSLTVGLGVAYSIHLSERFNQELDRADSVWGAMRTSVTGTGGALLGSAATTVGGFGVLAFAILPALQQFGIITGLTIVYAFLASVLVLPSLLVVWTRHFGPEWTREQIAGDAPAAEASAQDD